MPKHKDVRTLYAYYTENEGELSFESGVVMKILDKSDKHWWMAYDKSTCNMGLIPYNYVEEIVVVEQNTNEEEVLYSSPQEVEIQNSVKSDKNNNKEKDSDDPFEDEKFMLTSFDVRTKYSYTSQRPDELSFKADTILKITGKSLTNKGWWKGVNEKGEIGLVPSNYVEDLASSYLSPTAIKPTIFSYHKTDTNTDSREEKEPKKADLLKERKNPFPNQKLVEMASNPSVRSLKERLFHQKTHDDFEREAWYFGKITRKESESILENPINGSGDFLIRASESNTYKWALSLKTPDEIRHYKIDYKDTKYIVGHRLFNNMKDLIAHYTSKTQLYTSKTGQAIFLSKPANKIRMT